MKTIETLITKKKIVKDKEDNKNIKINEIIKENFKQDYRTLLSNILVNENSHNLKLLSAFDPKKDEEFEVENNNTKLKIRTSDLLGEQTITKFNDTQGKIWDFILTQCYILVDSAEIKKVIINLAELCDFLGQTFQTQTVNNLKENLNLMSKVKLKYKYKGIDDAIGNLFLIDSITKKSEIIIVLGTWFDVISQNKELQSYMLVNSKTYTNSKTNNGSDPHYIISRKIHEIYKNNFSKHKKIIEDKGQYEISISSKTFIKSLCWSEISLKKDTKKFYNKLIEILKKIEKEQKIYFDIIDCNIKGLNKYELFLRTKFIFYSDILYKEYKEKGYN